MKSLIFSQFKSDLLKLYCQTKNKDIETLFLRLAGTENNFCRWFSSNILKLKKKISNPALLDTLEMLCDLEDSGVSLKDDQVIFPKVIQKIVGNVQMISVLKSFEVLIGRNKFPNVLGSLRDNIKYISEQLKDTSGEFSVSSKIISDLKEIEFMFSTMSDAPRVERKTKKDLRKNMFVDLLKFFSNQIANVFENNDMPEMASKIRSGMLATRHPELLDYTGRKMPTPSQMNAVKNVLTFIWERPESKWFSYHCDYIDLTFFRISQLLSIEDFVEIKTHHESKKNFIEDFIEEKDRYDGIDMLGKTHVDMKISPDYIAAISDFFNTYRSKLNI